MKSLRRERGFTPEKEQAPPAPSRGDLVCIDGRFAQCAAGDADTGVTITFIDDDTTVRILPDEWMRYTYEKPSPQIRIASDLVENGLMTEEQLQKVFWGSPQQEEYPYLRGEVTFFGDYTKR